MSTPLRLVPPPSESRESSWQDSSERIELRLDSRELVLIHRALEAAKTLGIAQRQDVLLNDTIHLVDIALKDAA